jgi:cyclase
MQVLVALVTAGALSVAVAAYQQPAGGGQAAARVVEVEKLKDNLFVLRGQMGGGNTAVFVMSNGVTVVDTKNPGWGQPILDKIKELTNKPVVRIINTHSHGDHVSGNVEFPDTVEVVTHQVTKANMDVMRTGTGFKPPANPTNIFTENKGRGLPKRTFRDRLFIGSGNDQIELRYFGRGHTGGDAWVIFPSLRIVHAGDMFAGKNIPIMDAANGGSGVAYGDTLAKAAGAFKATDTIITGHSTQMTVAELLEFAQFNRDFVAAVREGKKAGRTIDEIAKGWTTPEKYKGYGTPNPDRLRANVEVVFNEIK